MATVKLKKPTQEVPQIKEINADKLSSSEGNNEKEMQEAFLLALKDGEANSSSVSIYVLGQENTGKSSLVASLLGDYFEERIATQGVDVDLCKIFGSNWSRVGTSEMAKKLKNMFHSKLKVTAQIMISAEQKQPALRAQNRQQLLESLPELPEAVKADLEQAKSVVLIDEDGINAIIWDFAGHSVYYGLHSMFLKEDNVAMIVFDASQPLQDPVKGRGSHKDPYTQESISSTTTGCESVCYWLQSIHSIRKDGTPLGATSIFVPTVFLVATHIDLIGDSEAVEVRKKEIIDQLFLLLRNKPFAKHIAGVENGLRKALEKNCFFISNKVRNEEELDRLRSMLVEALLYIKNRQHPVVFLNIEQNLLSLNKAIISVREFHSIAFQSGFFAKPESIEMNGALAYFHSKGTILHFPRITSLKDLVVLSPDWLTKLFSYIIIAHPYQLEIDYDLQFQRLKDHGILEEDFITFMVSKFNKEQEKFGLPLSTKQAIEFAQCFGFITEVHNNTYFLEEPHQLPVSDKRVFIVPPMLPLQLPDNVQLPDDKDPQARIVYFRFSEGFIPPMVYYHMLSVCINRNIRRSEHLYWIRRQMIKMVLGRDQLYYVSLCEDHHSIRLAITPDEDGVVSPQSLQERWKLIEDFNAKLREIVKAFMPASDLPQRYIPCSFCPNLHLNLDAIRADEPRALQCLHGKLPKDYYSDLKQYQVGHETGGINLTGDFKLISQKVPTMIKLCSLLVNLRDWEKFGYQLLPEDKEHLVEEIKIDYEGTNACKIALFRAFLQCGIRTWEQVIKALERSGEGDMAKQVTMQLFKDFGNPNDITYKDLWTQHELEQNSSKCIELPKHRYRVLQNVVVLLVTANTSEALAAYRYLHPLLHHDNIYRFNYEDHSGTQTEYYIGMYGVCPAAILNVSTGTKVHGSISNVVNQCFPNLGAIISVGVACGIEEKVKLCDVLVSLKIVKYDKNDGKYLTLSVSPQLIKLFDQYVEWPNEVYVKRLKDNGVSVPNVKLGTILSGPPLDDNSEMKKTLNKNFAPEAIGFEIEGGHLLAEIQETETSIIVVKAVCELAHGKDSKDYQPTAALLSADLVHKHLSKSEAHEIFSGKIILRRMLQQAKNENMTINVRHAKILFCGASCAGKTSFSRLLRSKKHEAVYISTPAGNTQQVLLAGEKINVEGTNWVGLDSESETQELSKRLFQKLKATWSSNIVLSDDNTNDIEVNVPDVTEARLVDTVSTEVKENKPKAQPVDVVADKELPTSSESKVESKDDSMEIYTEEEMLNYKSTSESIPETWDLFTLLDTGGQPEFINLLPAINSSTAITFVVLNMSKGLKGLSDSLIAQYKCPGYNYKEYALEYTNLHLLKCLLSSVKVAAMKKDCFHPEFIKKVTDDEQVKPVVGIIGTCADVLEKEFGEEYNQEFRRINKEVMKLVETIEKEKEEVLRFWCNASGAYVIPIDNTTSNRSQNDIGSQDLSESIQHETVKNVETIREKSNEILKKKAQYEIPISWLILELELRKCKKVCIHLSEVETICNNIMPSHRQMKVEEIKEVLKFYHMYGMLLYFNEVGGLKDFVITNPQWLFINLTKIIMCKFEDGSHDLYGAHYIKEFHNGICHMELLKHLKLDLQGIELESFVELLVYLKIIAPMIQNGYFMPTSLPLCDKNTRFSEKIYGKPAAFALDGECICQEVSPLLIEFAFGTIPRGLFGFLVVQLLQDKQDFKLYGNNDHGLFRCADLITFHIKPCYYVSLRDKVSYLELQVRVKDNKPSYHCMAQTAVSSALKKVCGEFYWKYSDVRYGFLCCQHDNGSQSEHLTLLSTDPTFPDKIPEYCYCVHDQSTCVSEAHSIWFKSIQEISKASGDKVKDIKIKEVYQKFYKELIMLLPMKNPVFSACLITMFTGDLKEKVETKSTQPEAASCFLDRVIGPALECNIQEPFNILLSAMENYGDIPLRKLSEKIKKEIGTCETITEVLSEDESGDKINYDSSPKGDSSPKDDSSPKGKDCKLFYAFAIGVAIFAILIGVFFYSQ